jgi:hypothetical protein
MRSCYVVRVFQFKIFKPASDASTGNDSPFIQINRNQYYILVIFMFIPWFTDVKPSSTVLITFPATMYTVMNQKDGFSLLY